MTAIIISLGTHRSTPTTRETARSIDPLTHPLLASMAAKLAPSVAQEIGRILSDGVTFSVTTAELARRIVAQGLDRRTAEGLARTGTAIIAADARQRSFSL